MAGANRREPKVTLALTDALHYLERAAATAQSDYAIDDTENDACWALLKKIRYDLSRVDERIYQPEHVKDVDEELRKLLGREPKEG